MLLMASLRAGAVVAALPRRSGDPEMLQLIGGAVPTSRPHSCRRLLHFPVLHWLTPFLQPFFMLSSLYILQANATGWLCWLMGAQIGRSRFRSYTVCKHLPYAKGPCCPLCRVQGPTMHYGQALASGSSTTHIALCRQGPPFPLGVPMLSLLPVSTCLLLPMPASLYVPLHPISLHPSVWLWVASCFSCSPLLGSSQIWPSKACWRLCTLCFLRGHSHCVRYIIFLIMLPLAQVPFTWNRQVFFQHSSVFIALLELAQRACISGACPGADRPPNHEVLFIF